jgi:DNA (cytosine-5)-methyltransferase 1
MAPNSTVSLFAGCGGFDAGFAGSGFVIAEAHDIDPIAISTYNANHNPVGRITDLRREHDIKLSAADVVIGGPPCQGFSTIGNLKRDDERNALLMAGCRIALRLRPKMIVLENVMGLEVVPVI